MYLSTRIHKLHYIPSSLRLGALFVSEPNPSWFGNGPNEKSPSWTNGNWLKSRFHFSFAEYRNPANSQFGPLRVMNDDLVQPLRGFGTHPHRDAEIMTYVVQGTLTHEDSMGNKGNVNRGGLQYLAEPCTDRLFPKMGECREVLGGGPAPPSKL